jgi:outer membrane protein assembly factor BamB
MKIDNLGKIDLPGGVEPGACLTSANQIVLVLRWRDTCTVVGLQFAPDRPQFRQIWHHEFTGNVEHQWAGHSIVMNFPSLLLTEDNLLYVIGGTERLLIDTEKGLPIVQTTGLTSPTATASLVNNEILVPEGQALSAYDATSLRLNWRQPTPQKRWAFASVVNRLLPLQSELDETSILWHIDSHQLWSLPNAPYLTLVPVTHHSSIVVLSGVGPPNYCFALDLKTNALQWSFDCSRLIPLTSQIEGILPFPNPAAISYKEQILIATAKPTLEAVSISDGRCLWQINLSSAPTELAQNADITWIATFSGELLAVNTSNGKIFAQATVSDYPISILPLSKSTNQLEAIILGRLKTMYKVTT